MFHVFICFLCKISDDLNHYCMKQWQRKAKYELTFVDVTDSCSILWPVCLQVVLKNLFISQLTGTFESKAHRKRISGVMGGKNKKWKNRHVSVDVELIAVTSQITKQAFCAKEFSAGVCIPVTVRFLSLLPSPPLLSSLSHPPLQLAPSHLSGMMEWLPCSTPPFPSPVTLHVYPNIHCVCQTGRFPRCPSHCPCLSADAHALTHVHTH